MYDKTYYDGEIGFSKQQAIEHSRTEYVWLLHKDVDYTNFDFRYVPSKYEQQQAHAWPSHNNTTAYTTWLLPVKDFTETNYHSEILPVRPNTPRYVNWPNFVDVSLSGNDWYDCLCNWLLEQPTYVINDEWVWVVDDRVDYDHFDFNWRPSYFDQQYIHCFTMDGVEQLSYTWLVNRNVLRQRQFKFVHSNLDFFKPYYDHIVLDMGFDNDNLNKKLRFAGTMDAALKSAIKRADQEWLFVTSTCCDYTNFNFQWLPNLDQLDHTHCWPSNNQHKGETFLIHVPSHRARDEFKFNFDHEPVVRKDWPIVYYSEDSLAKALQQQRLSSVYTIYTKNDPVEEQPTPCLWDKRPIVSMNESQSTALIPRDCVVSKELYEYPFILKEYMLDKELMDVIFISYDEPQADANWEIVKQQVPRAQRLHGVKGMERALEAAARMSKTDCFYAVFAKTKLHETFDFTFVPDYFQKPKHYIFDCINTMNGLRYGHMGVIMYNKNLILNNIDKPFGLDYTMSWEHAVIPIVSCYGEFNSTAFQTWRTAFRECCKIPYYNAKNPSIEADYRLYVWQTQAEGKYAEWCLKGARDGVVFSLANRHYYDVLKQTFDWQWLRNYFTALYGDIE